jgi:hypothetical protein
MKSIFKNIKIKAELLFLITALTAGIFNSCRSIAPVVRESVSYTADEIYENVARNEPDIKTYSAGRVSFKINDNDEELNLRGSVRINKDSAILVSINAFAGIEAARLFLSPDSVKILDRINNRYFLGNYEEAEKFFPVRLDYGVIQSIFLGSSVRIFDEFQILDHTGTRYLFQNDVMTVSYSGEIFPHTGYRSGDDMLQIDLDNSFFLRDIQLFSTENDIYTRLRFNSFSNTNGQYFPDNIDFHFVSHNLPLHANIRFGRIEIDRELNFPFSIPSRYKPF